MATVALPAGDSTRIAGCLQQLDACRMMAYQGAEMLFASIPARPLDLIVLGPDLPDQAVQRITRWSRRHWPRCMTVMLGQAGDTSQEMTARRSGAMYFASPVAAPQWQAVLAGAAQCRSARLKSA